MHDDEPDIFAFTYLLPVKASATFCICREKKRVIPARDVFSGEVLSREDVSPAEIAHCYGGCFMVSPGEALLTAITVTG